MKISTFVLSSVLLIVVSATEVAAQSSSGRNWCTEERMSKRLSRMDSDGDGKLSAKEIDGMRVRPIERADKDGDGQLSLEEFLAGKRQPSEGAEQLFAEIDADKSGKITAEENAANQKSRMMAMDTDKDGFVTVQEMVAGCAQ